MNGVNVINTKEPKIEIHNANPLFFTYTLSRKGENNNYQTSSINSESNIFAFICNKCGRSFDEFFVLKRHILQVEFGLKNQCKYCLKYFKRVKEHYSHCSSYFSSHLDIINNIRNRSLSNIKSNLRHNIFNLKEIVNRILPELMSS